MSDVLGTINQEHAEEMVNRLTDTVNKMTKRISLLEEQLSEALQGKVPLMEQINFRDISVFGGIAGKDRHPFVEMRWGLQFAQFDEFSARGLCAQIFDAVAEAKQDADLFHFFASMREEREAFNFVSAFRSFRNLRRMEEIAEAFRKEEASDEKESM